MFVRSFKVPSRRLLGIGLMFFAALALIVYGVGQRITKTDAGAKVEAGEKTAVSEKKKAGKGAAKTPAERMAFITGFGWEAEEEPAEIAEIILPEEFDDVYEEYNVLQKNQGYDLQKYAGKRCKRYTYQITNYVGCPDTARLNLLVCDGKVIGGDVSSAEQGGFMHGFAPSSPASLEAQALPVPSAEETAVWEGSITAPEPPIEETMAEDLAAIADALAGEVG